MDYSKKKIIVRRNKKGVQKLMMDNYTYAFLSQTNAEHKWTCSYKKTLACKAELVTNLVDGKHKLKTPPIEHSHPPIRIMQDSTDFLGGVLHVSMEVPLIPPGLKRKRKIVTKINRPEICESDVQILKMMKWESNIGKDDVLKETGEVDDGGAQSPRIKHRRPEIDAENVPVDGSKTDDSKQEQQKKLEKEEAGDKAESETLVPEEDKLEKEDPKEISSAGAEAEPEGLVPEEDKSKAEEPKVSTSAEKKSEGQKKHKSSAAKTHSFGPTDMEDGTVNIQLFVEENLLSSFIVNSQFTSNVNIRIAKGTAQMETVTASI